jgi:hypothetical protein
LESWQLPRRDAVNPGCVAKRSFVAEAWHAWIIAGGSERDGQHFCDTLAPR